MRRDMVTRTVLGTKVVAKVVDPATDAISTEEVLLTGTYKAEETKTMRKVVDAVAPKVVIKLETVEPFNKLYGVDTKDFMKMAKELDPETRKVIETETEDEE